MIRGVSTLLAMSLLLTLAACTPADPVVRLNSSLPTPERTNSGTWLSGESGNGLVSGQFAAWRGAPVDIAGTWSDSDQNSLHFWQLQEGGDLASWKKPIDIAVGAIDSGETWAAAAKGEYDARWAQSLKELKSLRAGTDAITYIRFAHEMNGDWYPWQVNGTNYEDFIVAWKRYRALQQAIFPKSKLVFSVNRQSIGAGMDWRKFFPGRRYVDVISVDYYNETPVVSTTEDWNVSLNLVDEWGAPIGVMKHLEFAQREGLPLAISEWSGDAQSGDSPAFVENLLQFVKSHAGPGAGQVVYEILFDVPQDNGRFVLFDSGNLRMPNSSLAYRRFFEDQGVAG